MGANKQRHVIEIQKCYNENVIKYVLFNDDIWSTIADETVDKKQFKFDFKQNIYLRLAVGVDVIGFYILHPMNSATLFIHANILPQYRKDYAKESGYQILKWIDEMMPDQYQKLVAQIPSIYQNVYHFTKKFGFRDEGFLTNAYRKNGETCAIHILGLDRSKIKGLTWDLLKIPS